METATKALRLEFEQARTELECIEAKLEAEFKRMYEIERRATTNPYEVITRLKKLKQELETLKHDNELVTVAKQEFIHETEAQLAKNHDLLVDLQNKASIKRDPDLSHTLEKFTTLSGNWQNDIKASY
ncbi:2678_t:CDS:2 [Paraglomus occultum]|uniref:Protein FAM33A n=1 Tax=Paraglomus occultum TaxID=144539 RepID=A0A9N8WE71_9GLOM|nr:2678_t:CDS:2 [Paraglomus occultum]